MAPARQGRGRGGGVLAAVDGHPAPLAERPAPPHLQHVRPVARRARSSSAGTARSASWRSTWPARRPARPPASCSVATCRRSGRRARSSGCSGSCSRPVGCTTRSTGRAAAIVSQLMALVVINIVFGFASGGSIDNAAHLGGLAAGLWLGALVPPTGVPTMSSLWQRPGATTVGPPAGRPRRATSWVSGSSVVAVVVVAGLAIGTGERQGSARPGAQRSAPRHTTARAGVRPAQPRAPSTTASPLERRRDRRLDRQEAVVLADGRHQARSAASGRGPIRAPGQPDARRPARRAPT